MLRGGEHGGNMDTRLVRAGSRLYLRTFVDGGMVYFGDVHAAMGDGEVFLSGVEIAGRIQARVTDASDWSLPTPIVETDEVVAVIASGATLDEAASAALHKGVRVLAAAGVTCRRGLFDERGRPPTRVPIPPTCQPRSLPV